MMRPGRPGRKKALPKRGGQCQQGGPGCGACYGPGSREEGACSLVVLMRPGPAFRGRRFRENAQRFQLKTNSCSVSGCRLRCTGQVWAQRSMEAFSLSV